MNRPEMSLDAKIITKLEQLGFNISHPGTYIYKSLILKLIKLFEINELENDIIQNIQNPYSTFYEDIAKYEFGYDSLIKFHLDIIPACPSNLRKTYLNSALSIARDFYEEELKETNNIGRK